MKLSSRTKKILTVSAIVAVAVTMAGCSVPRDADGNIILIERSTTFSETMDNENWFSAIFVWPLAQLINILTPHVGVAGAIAVVTIVINGILALLTLKSTVAQQEMQLIQPELEKIQRKYEGREDDVSKNRMAQEVANLYAKHNINPMGTMLVTFIQFPIIMAMYMAVERAYAVAKGTFMGLSLSLTPLQGLRKGMWLYLVIFVVMGFCQFLSMYTPQYLSKKRAEKEAAKHHRRADTSTNKQSKMMQIYMMAMVLIFGLMWPTAMTVYWTINSLVNVAKTFLVQKYIDRQNEAKGR